VKTSRQEDSALGAIPFSWRRAFKALLIGVGVVTLYALVAVGVVALERMFGLWVMIGVSASIGVAVVALYVYGAVK
jgi:uncharacterized membrane protein